jgi:hypothetical protein
MSHWNRANFETQYLPLNSISSDPATNAMTHTTWPKKVKFGFSEKATKFEKIFVVLLTRASCSVRATAYLSKSRRRFFETNVVKSYYTNFTFLCQKLRMPMAPPSPPPPSSESASPELVYPISPWFRESFSGECAEKSDVRNFRYSQRVKQ